MTNVILGKVVKSSTTQVEYVVSASSIERQSRINNAFIIIYSNGQIICAYQSSKITMEALGSDNKVFQQILAQEGTDFDGFSRNNDLYYAVADVLSVVNQDDLSSDFLKMPVAGHSEVFLLKDSPLPEHCILGKLACFCERPLDDTKIAIVGHDCQDPDSKISIITKDSQKEKLGGFGEGKFIFIGGRSGSRKTIEGLKYICVTLANNPNMGFLSIDPKGELFANDKFIIEENVKEFRHYDLIGWNGGKQPEAVALNDIRCTDKTLLNYLLHQYFRNGLGMTDDSSGGKSKSMSAAEHFAKEVFVKENSATGTFEIDPEMFIIDEFLDERILEESVRGGYSQKVYADNAWKKAKKLIDSPIALQLAQEICTIFTGETTDIDLLRSIAKEGRRVFLHFDPAQEETITLATVSSFLSLVKDALMSDYKNAVRTNSDTCVANFILAIEEAHTFFPSKDLLSEDPLAKSLNRTMVDAITKLRAMGVHFYFITQSAGNFNTKIIDQCSTKLFGKGLEATTADTRLMKDVVGSHMFEQYALASRSCGSTEAIFCLSGDLCNLRLGSMTGIIYKPIEGDITTLLKRCNPHIYQN